MALLAECQELHDAYSQNLWLREIKMHIFIYQTFVSLHPIFNTKLEFVMEEKEKFLRERMMVKNESTKLAEWHGAIKTGDELTTFRPLGLG